jgi:hypothetical protein
MALITGSGLTDLPGAALKTVTDPVSNLVSDTLGVVFGRKSRPERGPDFPDGFRVVEIIDGHESPDSEIRLTGNMLPFTPFEWGGEQRLGKEYYPGNPEPAVQVLGAKEGDVTIHGKFKDKRLKDPSLYGVAYKLAEYMDKLRRRGNLCKFSLGPWVRYGFIEKTDFKLDKLSSVEYSLQLFVVGFNPPTNCKIVARTKEIPLATNKELIKAVSDFNAKYSAVPTSMPKSIGDVLNGAIGDVAKAINLVTNFVDAYVTAAEDVQKSVNRALGLIKNARTQLGVFKRRIGGLQTGFNSLSNDTKAATNFSAVFTNQRHIIESVSATSSLAALLAAMQKQFEAIARTTPQARYKVIDGDTLQKVSLKFYKSADHWNLIYDHNKLSTTVLTQGMMLEIPHL